MAKPNFQFQKRQKELERKKKTKKKCSASLRKTTPLTKTPSKQLLLKKMPPEPASQPAHSFN